MALRRRVWSAGKLLVLVGALVATYVSSRPRRCASRCAPRSQVPDFTNLTANEATAMASGLGLAVHVDDARRLDPKIAAGNVLGQEPPAGTTARVQRAVRLWLSAGPRAAIVPLLKDRPNARHNSASRKTAWTSRPSRKIRSEAFPRTSSSRKNRQRTPPVHGSPCW
jgi:hypothetical protein